MGDDEDANGRDARHDGEREDSGISDVEGEGGHVSPTRGTGDSHSGTGRREDVLDGQGGDRSQQDSHNDFLTPERELTLRQQQCTTLAHEATAFQPFRYPDSLTNANAPVEGSSSLHHPTSTNRVPSPNSTPHTTPQAQHLPVLPQAHQAAAAPHVPTQQPQPPAAPPAPPPPPPPPPVVVLPDGTRRVSLHQQRRSARPVDEPRKPINPKEQCGGSSSSTSCGAEASVFEPWVDQPSPDNCCSGLNDCGSNTTRSRSTPTAQTSSETGTQPPGPPGEPPEECDDCPICLGPIDRAEAVMRCRNSRHPHFFHKECMSEWIQTNRQQWRRPTCPVCRTDVEFHARNLNSFLDQQGQGGAGGLTEEEYGFFESVRRNLNGERRGEWSSVTWENVTYAGGLIACFGMGFYSGYNYDTASLGVGFIPHDTDNRVAQGVGWMAGILAKEIKKWNDRKSRRDRDY